eukprot:247570-Pyramimonas_sp.AAC.1
MFCSETGCRVCVQHDAASCEMLCGSHWATIQIDCAVRKALLAFIHNPFWKGVLTGSVRKNRLPL